MPQPLVTMVLGLGVTLLVAGPLWARKPRPKPTTIDPSYVSALAVTNRFLHAWQSGDLEAGMVLISDRARHSLNPEAFEDFFSSQATRGFEITRGAGGRGRYRFPVVLVTTRGKQVQRKYSQITITDAGKNDWVIDKLP